MYNFNLCTPTEMVTIAKNKIDCQIAKGEEGRDELQGKFILMKELLAVVAPDEVVLANFDNNLAMLGKPDWENILAYFEQRMSAL